MPARLLRRASQDLDDIYRYGIERWGGEQAERYAEAFWHAVTLIEASPLASRLREEVRPPVRVRRYQAYLIIYEANERGGNEIVTIRVAHARSDWSNDLI